MADIKLMSASGMFDNLSLSLPPNNEIVLDDAGLPSVMVKIPKLTYEDLGLEAVGTGTFPAWIVNGEEVPYIYISKYQNVVIDGKAYSLPYKQPKNRIKFDDALQYCEAKGAGWHLMSNIEWQAIALWCAKHDCMPYGNNNSGYDYYHTSDCGVIMPDGSYNITATGSGPKDWFHNNDFSGIADMNGNLAELVGGIRIYNGEFQVIPDNNTVLHLDQSTESTEWKAILPGSNSENATLVTPGTAGTLVNISGGLGVNGTDTPASSSAEVFFERKADTCSSSLTAVPALAYAHGLLNHNITTERTDAVYFNVSGEKLFRRGGSYSYNAVAGVFYVHGNTTRTYAYVTYGFRSAFVPLQSA